MAMEQDPRTQVRGFRFGAALATIVAAALLLAATAIPARAATPATASAGAALDHIEANQNADGGFPAFGPDSSPGSTLDAVFALVAGGRDPTAVTSGGSSPADYLAAQAAAYAADPGAAAKLALGVSLMGLDPAAFGGVDLPAAMDAAYDPATGAYGLDLFDEALYLLALEAAGQPVPAALVAHLQSLQQPDGGWEFLPGFGTDNNTTSFVLQGLLAAGVPTGNLSVRNGLAFLGGLQEPSGGFSYSAEFDAEPSSTALAIQALVAAGEDTDAGGPWAPGGNEPLDALLAMQNPATGAFQFGGFDSLFSTYQAVPGAMMAPFPYLVTLPDGVTPLPTPTPMAEATATSSPTATPTALAESEGPSQLPDSGGEPAGPAGAGWRGVAVLLGMWTGVAALGVVAVRRRRER
jgi:hypothetical protein